MVHIILIQNTFNINMITIFYILIILTHEDYYEDKTTCFLLY
jgi:hypothetical protein